MKPIDQTEVGLDNPRANCLMAAIASILEVAIDSLPDVYELERAGVAWYSAAQRALEPHGLVPVFYNVGGPNDPPIAPLGYHVAIGISPRDPKITHAVVALDGQVTFDPHPSRAGIVGPIASWMLLMPAAR